MHTRLLHLSCAALFLLASMASGRAQSFDETWKEFLLNDKVSNISALAKPDKRFDKADYVKYVLMNTNNDFCASEVSSAEERIAEVYTVDATVHASIPGFVDKLTGLERKVKAFYSIEEYWQEFLKTESVSIEELTAVKEASRLCEKQTAAKLNYMVAFRHLCAGDHAEAKRIFEDRTLKLAEKTSLKVEDVEGLAPRVAEMKQYFILLPKLERAWESFVDKGSTSGFKQDLPVFTCNPEAQVKALILRGNGDLCGEGAAALDKVAAIRAQYGGEFEGDLEIYLEELTEAVQAQQGDLDLLNQSWEAFLPESKVDGSIVYGHTYCDSEALIRAYLLDGYSFVCGLAETNLARIDSIRKTDRVRLDKVTAKKIKELGTLRQAYEQNGVDIEQVWQFFVVNGDSLLSDYESTDMYCDHIQEVKDWTMRGLTGTCDEALGYLKLIDDFNDKFDFKFYEDLECRVQRLRQRIWDCRYDVIDELAHLEAAQSSYEQRLGELMAEYEMPERPADCATNE